MRDTQDPVAALHRRVAELEAELRTAESRLRLFEQALDLMCVAGADGYFKELNASWTDVLGWTLEELLAAPFVSFVHPEDQAATLEAAGALIGGSRVTAFQNRYRHKDGSFRWLSWNAVFDGDSQRILAVARDMTEFVTTRQALDASEAAYRQLFDGMLDGFSYHDMLFDADGEPFDYRFRAVNPAFEEMTGLKAKDIVGRRVLEVLPGTEQHWIDVFGNVAKTGVPIRYENYSQAFDKWFEVLAFRPGQGQFACTFHDITARRKAETERAELQAQVEHAQKLESLGMMAGGIAHDFNNLLTAILGGVELATESLATSPASARADLTSVTAAAERARDLCRQMLTYAGRTDVKREAIDLADLSREILALAAPSLSKKLTLRCDRDGEPMRVVIDPAQISQVLLNLILNAGEAIGDNPGEVSVRTGACELSAAELGPFQGARGLSAGPHAFIEVRDTGSGMSEETLQKVFDPFFTTKFAGRGLGLATAMGIIRAHGGGVRVESQPGKGTRFFVVLPLTRAESTSTPVRAARTAWAATGTILVCDDEGAVRRVIARLVNSLGFDVLEASDGQEALDFFDSRPQDFRAILLDMTMPKLGGRELLPLVRERSLDIPVILMSGYDEGKLADVLGAEHVTFLDKPFRREELERAFRRVLEAG